MLLCVAGGGTEFSKNNPRAGARCSFQSLLFKNNANLQVRVEDRSSMPNSTEDNSAQVSPGATLSLHLRTNQSLEDDSGTSRSKGRNKLIVISGEGSGSLAENGGSCTTTTTFKSNVVNGKRSTNTILVRYRPGKAASVDSEDELQFEFDDSKAGSSLDICSTSRSGLSARCSPSKLDKTSTSSWAEIMELEGYRSPAIGLDNVGIKKDKSKAVCNNKSDSSLVHSKEYDNGLLFDKYNNDCVGNKSPVPCYDSVSSQYNNVPNNSTNAYFRKPASEVSNIDINNDSSSKLFTPIRLAEVACSVSYNPNIQFLETGSKFEADNLNENSFHNGSSNTLNNDRSKVFSKSRHPMRSESSRISKTSHHERNKNRRKTLPDGNFFLNSNSRETQSSEKKSQRSPEHDPNASWGRYNSRAMRDSVRKYAETLYLRRQMHSKLDSLPETKGIQLTRYVSANNNQDHVHSLKGLYLRNNSHSYKNKTNSTTHLHEMPPDTDSLFSNSSNFHVLPSSISYDRKLCDPTNVDVNNKSCLRNTYKSTQCLHQSDNFIKGQKSGLNFEPVLSNSISSFSHALTDKSLNKHRNTNDCEKSDDYILKEKIHPPDLSNRNFLETNSSKITVSIEPKTVPTNSHVHLSVNMQEIKSKLCADCAQSADLGPPPKQSASRSKHQHFKTYQDPYKDQSKRSPIIACDSDEVLCVYHQSIAKQDNQSFHKDESSVDFPDKYTKLTAREMSELVHGKLSGGLNDPKTNQVSVSSKVSNWIQKQRDKRKPVFFIGDAPSFNTDNSGQLEGKVKLKNRKSRRSLSLTSVRESEISVNSSGRTESPVSFNSTKSDQSDDKSVMHNERKGLFIKRTSSCCSNKGSTCRKARQGSLIKHERDPDYNQNQINENVSAFESCYKHQNDFNKIEVILNNQGSYEKHLSRVTLPESKDELNSLNTQVNKNQQVSIIECSYSQSSGDWRMSPDINEYQDSSPNDNRNERLALAKKFLNFKQLSRALSLHSLKKKSRDSCESQLPAKASGHLVKWSRGSKRKIEHAKFGSLRKSLSYCELTARESKLPDKSPLPLKSDSNCANPSEAPPVIRKSRKSGTSCPSSLRRSVSLSWQFPLARNPGYRLDTPQEIALSRLCFLRLHCRNSVLPFMRNLRKSTTGEVSYVEKDKHKKWRSHHVVPQFSGSDANILRKRTASTSDYSPKSKNDQRPLSVVESLSPETTNLDKNEVAAKNNSDISYSDDHPKTVTSLDQVWRSNPVKLCRVHSRLLMCRHKGRYRLRRSISQPVELEMSGSIHSLKESAHGSADNETFQKSSLSSDDEASSESDIYHSYCCSPTRRTNTCYELSGESALYAEALWDHETLDSEELPFQAGDVLEVTDTSDQDWWWGIKDGQGGWFPSAFVRLYVSHRGPALHFNGQTTDESPFSPSKVLMNNLSLEQVRANVVQEIVATERDYVKHLKDVVEGYLKQVQRRPDMFSKERIDTVFGNIQEIYVFQSEFLKQLENCLDNNSPHLSQIGNCFLDHKEEFKMYSQYCNNHPLAVSELQELYCESQYIHFFEACRLLQEMIDISLDGFLLTPIQRICKYPLQLAELLKCTEESHPDYIPVTNAFAAMKEVAELVNERKRRMECLERIAEWQNTIEGWEGPDVLDTSSILIHCGEVTRVSSSWSRDIYLFIFDHQLIYCKKDLLKRHTYAYKGRLNLDHCDIIDVEDGKDSTFAVNVKNAWKIYCREKDKWYLFYAKTAPEKEQWLRAFKAERQRVNDDDKQAFVVTEEAKRNARMAVQNKQKPKRPRAKFAKGRRCHPDVAVTELLLESPSAKARSGSLPSNIHPELAILTGAKLGPTRKKGSGWFHFGSGKKPKS